MTNRQHLPRVTVVTAVYNLVSANRTEHFRQCIDSVLSQTYPDIEHLIIDGASTDGTLDLLREYDGKRGVRVLSEPDSGIYDAMNKGLAAATGKYIAFLNSDDFWHDPRGVAFSVECLERSGAVFSYAPCRYIHNDGTEAGNSMTEMGGLCTTMPFCHQTMFTQVAALRKAGGFAADEFRIAADYDIILNLLVHGAKPTYVPLVFTTFRRGGATFDEPRITIEETRKARERQLQRLLPVPVLDALECSYMPETLFRTLASVLHPSVMQCVADVHGPLNEHGMRLLLRKEQVSRDSVKDNYPLHVFCRRYTSIFGLPVLRSCRLKSGMYLYKLFGILPILGTLIQLSRKRTRWYLFGLLPIVDIQHRVYGTSTWKFCGIPVWRRYPVR